MLRHKDKVEIDKALHHLKERIARPETVTTLTRPVR